MKWYELELKLSKLHVFKTFLDLGLSLFYIQSILMIKTVSIPITTYLVILSTPVNLEWYEGFLAAVYRNVLQRKLVKCLKKCVKISTLAALIGIGGSAVFNHRSADRAGQPFSSSTHGEWLCCTFLLKSLSVNLYFNLLTLQIGHAKSDQYTGA